MKKLKLFIPLLIILMVLPACEKENTFEDQVTLNEQVIFDDQVAEARNLNLRPFHATFTSTVVSFQPNPEVCGEDSPARNLIQSVSGKATHMGNISGSISSCVIPKVIIFNAEITLVAANGDELFFERSGPGAFEINDGTGRFAGATGSVIGSFVVIVPGSVFTGQLDGRIQY